MFAYISNFSKLIYKDDARDVFERDYNPNIVELVGNCLLDGAKIAADVELSVASKCISVAGQILEKDKVSKGVAILGGVIVAGVVIPTAPVLATAMPIATVAGTAINYTLVGGIAGFAMRTIGRFTNPELTEPLKYGGYNPYVIGEHVTNEKDDGEYVLAEYIGQRRT